jgi:hypothetical protein
VGGNGQGRGLADGRDFGDLQYFHYKGKPRHVKIWDEALIPWEELVLTLYEISGSAHMLSQAMAPIADRIIKITGELSTLKDGDTYQFPNFEEEYGETWNDIREDISVKREKLGEWERKVAYTLWKISGKKVQISKDFEGRTIIDWKQSLPEDFFPVVVFDASGRVRTMYDFYGYASDKLSPITEFERDFSYLTFHHINLGAGKHSWRTKPELLGKLTKTLLTQEPERATLVIAHLPEKTGKNRVPDIEKDLGKDCPNARFLTWGLHKQTNEFRDFDKLILPGLLYLPKSQIKVTTYASLQTPVTVKLEQAEKYFKEIERGEIRADLLQAVGRIARSTDQDGNPKPADVWIVASDQQAGSIEKLLEETFPGSSYTREKTPEGLRPTRRTTTHVDTLEAFMRAHAEKSPRMNLPFKVPKKQAFRNMDRRDWADLRSHERIKALCKELNWEEASNDNRSYNTHWRPLAA